MESNIALVFGALGQDGSFICDILLENGYKVYGIVKQDKIKKKYHNKKVNYLKVDITSKNNIKKIISDLSPTHIFNFMGVTNTFNPWQNSETIYELNFLYPLRIIESIKEINPNIKFLQASSSLVFGMSKESPQNENTNRNPIYHYGISKNLTDNIIKLYREKFNLYLCSAILYPHESERRNDNFFSKKIINESIKILNGEQDKIHVGDVEVYRDVGYAKDYMEACFLIINQETPDDYIIGTGQKIKNIDFIKNVFYILGLDIDNRLFFDLNLKRDYDLSHLIADSTKIRSIGWEPKNNINDIIKKMIKNK